MWDFIAKPFGFIMEFIYRTLSFENYGLAIILFTIFVRVLVLPLTIKQQKSTIKMQEIQPELDALKERYGDDKQKLYEEQNKIYQKYGVNSMAGCLPTFIQLPIILVLYQIIRRPLTYISLMSRDAIETIGEIAGFTGKKVAINNEINIISFFQNSPRKISEAAEKIGMTVEELKNNFIDMKFLKIFDLGLTPKLKFWEDPKVYLPLLIIPVVAFLTAWLQQKLVMPKQKKDKNQAPNPLSAMTNIMPFMSLLFCFILPAGLGLYFIIGNLLSIAQTILINKIYKKKKEES